MRLAATGLGMLVCTGLVGCMNTGKDKEKNKIGAKQPAPTPGLPGTPTISTGAARMPGANPYSTTGIQQTGGVAQQQRVGTTGQNTLNTPGVPQPNFGGPSSYGTPNTTIGAPGQTGVMPSVQPPPSGLSPASSGSPLGAAPPGNWPGAGTGTAAGAAPSAGRVSLSTPPAPQLNSLEPLPPPPPGSSTERASGGAYTPLAAPVPPAPPAVTPGPLG
ncbi:hypothetical protein C1280_28095 [Gemmata obscuriglobus]|uniref:Uncharacterized protein n=1 Tax=Gemmata obscuriglobus TaxID=114 RepID=A0A2Z3HBV8_9BACT|nr:hypothetical protein C1280_28095 [Gemmata obscuriglobus]